MNCLKIKKYLLFFLIFLNTPILFAQRSDIGNWFIYFGNQALNEKWVWHNEIQYRNYNFAGDLEQLLLRTGIGYNLTDKNNNLLLGYGFIHSQPYLTHTEEKTRFDEHRIFQQFINRHQWGRVYIQHRIRAEERFLPEDMQLRGRYFLALNIPFNHENIQGNTFYLSMYNEIFLNAQNSIFDRNRIYGALGYGLNKNMRIEVGYMSQILANSHRNQFQLVLFNNLPFYTE
jgi:hypothetical protein